MIVIMDIIFAEILFSYFFNLLKKLISMILSYLATLILYYL